MEKLKNLATVFDTVGEKVEEEVGLLVDAELEISLLETNIVSKGDFFEKIPKKTVLTRLSASGDQSGECFLFSDLKDSILLAGILVMLPANEIEERISKDAFGEEENDAFGEIANIIAGSLSTTFEEDYKGELHFVKKTQEPLNKNKLDLDSDDPFREQSLFLASFSLKKDGEDLKPFYIVLPTAILGIEETAAEPAAEEEKTSEAQTAEKKSPVNAQDDEETGEQDQGTKQKVKPVLSEEESSSEGPVEKTDFNPEDEAILILSDSPEDSQIFVESLEPQACQCICKNFHEDIQEVFQTKLIKGVFLIMKEVNDQGFATAIKVKSAASSKIPVIAAGPKWTRSKVLQAVKYGSCDVLMTPASVEEIQEKAQNHQMFLKASSE